ncbi:CBS domain-containing protein [Litoribrevibacter albus]|uniref:CBS domain-containing protein n=1 Tax=Litoribrevibacter albus TaxID=1473156 RepID=A0AA37SEP7_9GAMM|nr:CBS domain-containing protein [Litoribrevibacter albus]GLQ33156.1 hypothetical protein GCM10007876_36350 [Litoribrevibacter albus]
MTQYQPLKLVSLNSNVPSTSSRIKLPNIKWSLSSPASALVDAFMDQKTVTIHADDGLQNTLHVMHAMKVPVCLVENGRNEVIGIVTKRDVMGQRAVAYATKSGTPIAELSVRDVMIPRSSLFCISKDEARSADIGDVVETLKRIGDSYILITDDQVSSSVIHCVIPTSEINQLLNTHLLLGFRAINMMDMHFALSGAPCDF